jgi:predicted amidohydrolase YtcJ
MVLTERHSQIAPIRSLLDAGREGSLGTDNVPVSLFWSAWQNPRLNRYTHEQVAPDQALIREQALCGRRRNGAYLISDEIKKGSFAPVNSRTWSC